MASQWLFFAILVTVLSLITATLIRNRYGNGLTSLPGPFLASLTNLHRLIIAATGKSMQHSLALHHKYGPVVRVGPNCVSLADGAWIQKVYGTTKARTNMNKSEWYAPFDIAPGMQLTFSMRDEEQHRAAMKPIAGAYSMTAVKELEGLNDECTEIFIRKLGEMEAKVFDLGQWFHFYTFDVITSVTYSARLDFMEQGKDIDNILRSMYRRLQYLSIVAQMPWLHKYLLGSPVLAPLLEKWAQTTVVTNFVATQLQRYAEKGSTQYRDILARFKKAQQGPDAGDTPGKGMSDADVFTFTMSNILAGADTSAISLRSIFYHLLKNPSTYHKVVNEIDEADAGGRLSRIVSYEESLRLPYLQAVIKEAHRICPPVGMMLERVVPPGGAAFGDTLLPGGTIVGINSWVPCRDASIYPEPNTFRPERWLEADEGRLKLMERNHFVFGAGNRSCIGKNVAVVELSKLVPQLLRTFDFELADPEKTWELHDYFFVWQTGLQCRVRRR